MPHPLKDLQDTPFGACASGHFTRVNSYITSGWNIESQLPDGTRATHLVVIYRRPDILHLLITAGADVNARQESGLTPLHFAAIGGFGDMITILLENGRARIDIADKAGMMPLHYAAVGDRANVIELLVMRGARPESRECLGLTPLGCAVRHGKVDAVRKLLALGVWVDAKDSKGRTSLHLAADLDFYEIAVMLIAAGAGKEVRNGAGFKPRDILLKSHSLRMWQLLA